jgi:hypothetical protein
MTQGPLTRVGTKVARINLDVSRKLNWGRVGDLEFLVVDRNELDNWRVIRTVTRGFDRLSQSEQTSGDGSEVIIEVVDADPDNSLLPTLRTKDLHLRVDGEIYRVSNTEPIAPNEAQVYTLKCKTRTTRTAFDTSKG